MELLLAKRELLNLGKKLRGFSVVCTDGRCWVTQEGDERDHVLSSGSSMTILASGKVIISAVESCRLRIVAVNKNSDSERYFRHDLVHTTT